MIKERIIQLLESKGIGKEEFYKKIGMTSASFRGNAKNSPLNSNAIENILSEMPDVNAEWLITGKGDMYKKEQIQVIHQPKSVEMKFEEQDILLYDISAAANLRTLLANKNQNILGVISIPDMPKCDGAVCVTGDSMYPLLKSGDIIAYKEIHDFNNVIYGEIYLVSFELEGDEFLVVKYVNRSELEGHIKLVSYNQHHDPKDIPISCICAMALVKLSIRKNVMR